VIMMITCDNESLQACGLVQKLHPISWESLQDDKAWKTLYVNAVMSCIHSFWRNIHNITGIGLNWHVAIPLVSWCTLRIPQKYSASWRLMSWVLAFCIKELLYEEVVKTQTWKLANGFKWVGRYHLKESSIQLCISFPSLWLHFHITKNKVCK
jgi:hypothetical protein